MTTIYAIMIVIGFAPFMVALYKLIRLKHMRKNGVKATAVVKEIYGYSLRGMNRVLIEFPLENGRLVSQQIVVGGVPYKEGDQLPLIYNKNDPAKNIINSGSGYSILLVFTLLLAMFSIFACYKIKKGIETGNFE